jgi:DNA adenine methylase
MGTKTAGVPSEEHLVRCSVALRKAHLVCQDYMETLRQCTSTDFVYLDPPYPKSDSRDRGEYGIGAFNPDEETRLVAALKQLDRNGTKFLLSYKATNSFISILPAAFDVRRVYVSRSVSGFARGRCRVAEVFVRNYKIIE